MKKTWRAVLAVMAALLLAPQAMLQASKSAPSLDESVRHELVMLPFYSVFDQLSFQVKGDVVTLGGEVSRPTLKSDAENLVKRIPGVKSVDNQIEVLPLSPFDNQIRWAMLRAVYGNPTLLRYNLGAIAPIRIIVKNGNVTLEGVVATALDKTVAGLAANGVPGVFSVTNNLQVRTS
jgi:hyperosmotically inducible protein